MAHRKAGGSTRLGRDSISKRLGPKVVSGEKVSAGAVLVRQRGTVVHAGKNVKKGSDDTLFAAKAGVANFLLKKVRKFNGRLKATKFVSVK